MKEIAEETDGDRPKFTKFDCFEKLPRQIIQRHSRLIQRGKAGRSRGYMGNSPKKALSRIWKVSEINNTSFSGTYCQTERNYYKSLDLEVHCGIYL
jgi:hypothetical protein